MSTAHPDESSPESFLKRRVVQFAGLILVAFVAMALPGTAATDHATLVTLVTGSAAVVLCLLLNHHGHCRAASIWLWAAVGTVATVLMLLNQGLHDPALLLYPVILIGAGQVLRPRNFLLLLAILLLLVLSIGLATVAGLRADATVRDALDLQQTLAMLAVTGGMVWLVATDIRNAVARLQRQIAEAKKSDQTLAYLAQHDALTQLPNRALGGELLEQGMATTRRSGVRMALLFVDLDNFKDINDSLGHSAGDEFLKLVAKRLRSVTRASDVVCRQGGDEFLVGLVGITNNEDISAVASNILTQIKLPCQLRDTEIVASCSIGIAVYPDDGAHFEDLLRHADLARYHAKEAGRDTFRFFDEEINVSVSESLHLISTLRTAVAQQEFVLHYQPVIDLQSGALIGAEALVRWQNPKLGLVSPALFIPAAEKSGLIVEIGQWVIEEACRQMQDWRQRGAPPLIIAVNLSPVQFRRGDVEGIIERTLKKTGLEPQYLELEVTESTLVQDTEKFIQSLQRIKALGIRIAIDDFGTGYSNLSYLQRFAVDKLKIDQSFVKRLLNGPQDLAIVTAIIQMAKSMDLVTNAEGVEDAATRDLLAQIGCDVAQGYFFARPLPADKFEAFMRLPAQATPVEAATPVTSTGHVTT